MISVDTPRKKRLDETRESFLNFMVRESMRPISQNKWLLFILLLPIGAYMLYAMTPLEEIDTTDLPSNIVDMHVHTAGLGFGESGAFIANELKDSYKFDIYLNAFGTSVSEIQEQGDGVVLKKLADLVRNSRFVEKAIVLALDGVINEKGGLDREKTQVYIPNEFLGSELRKFPQLLFGASINPYRHDWRTRLDKVVADGAKLIKWIPSIQHIDPSDSKLIPFYQELKRQGLPLLSHTGAERSFSEAKDEFADPLKLELPLSLGVRVIAAHVATTGENEGFQDIDRLISIIPKYPNLYADISSLTQINKVFFWDKVFQEKLLKDRLLYGSDFPLINTPLVSPLHRITRIPLGQIKRILREENPLDQDVLYKVAMGVPVDVFSRGGLILSDME